MTAPSAVPLGALLLSLACTGACAAETLTVPPGSPADPAAPEAPRAVLSAPAPAPSASAERAPATMPDMPGMKMP